MSGAECWGRCGAFDAASGAWLYVCGFCWDKMRRADRRNGLPTQNVVACVRCGVASTPLSERVVASSVPMLLCGVCCADYDARRPGGMRGRREPRML